MFTVLTDGIIPILFLSVAELEKLYSFAVSGSEEEKLAASKVLCGASLLRGWNIQVLFSLKVQYCSNVKECQLQLSQLFTVFYRLS